jgi:ABC-2 type transport system permease protein
MSTAVATPSLDFSGTRPIPLSRLVKVELRKMVDTRAGMWLLIGIGAVTAAVLVLFFIFADQKDRTFVNFIGATGAPQGLLLPVLGILLITQEWGQRTALVTFSLSPHRGRVLLAKVLAAILLGLAAIVVAIVLAALFTAVGGSDDAWKNIGVDDMLKLALLQTTGVLQGLAFGALFLNSAAAIVVAFVLPIAWSIVNDLITGLDKARPWIDLNVAQGPLADGSHMSGESWAQLAVAMLIWVALPAAVGFTRVLRSEVK